MPQSRKAEGLRPRTERLVGPLHDDDAKGVVCSAGVWTDSCPSLSVLDGDDDQSWPYEDEDSFSF